MVRVAPDRTIDSVDCSIVWPLVWKVSGRPALSQLKTSVGGTIMKFNRRTILSLGVLGVVAGFERQALADKEDKEEAGFQSLFDGKTFEGWEGNLKVFRIQDGAIIGGTMKDKIPQNDFLCTKQEFGDFELRLQAKLVGEGANAGVQFRTQRIPNHHEVIGYQCDMGHMQGRWIWGS